MSSHICLLLMLLLAGQVWGQPVDLFMHQPRNRSLIEEEQIPRTWQVVSVRVPNELIAEPLNRAGEVIGAPRRFRIHAIDQHAIEQLHHHQQITISSNHARGRGGGGSMPLMVEFTEGTHLNRLRVLLLPE